MKHFLLATVAAITMATGAQASGKVYDTELWAETGRGWIVEYVPEKNTCIVGREHTNEVSLQVVYQPDSRAFTLRLLSQKWSKVEDGTTYKLRLEMDGGADRWQGTAMGFWTRDGYPGVFLRPLSTEFIQSLMRRNQVDFYNATSGAWITALALDGSSDAMVGLIGCLDAHGSGKSTPKPAQPKPQVREFQS
jgi:hypothetical protein